MLDDFLKKIETDLTANILPYWLDHAPDSVHGGFHSIVWNDGTTEETGPRTAVLTSRILWTYSRAYRTYQNPAYLEMARRALDYLRSVFWDTEHEGIFWTIGADGALLEGRKHSYAQAFAIYGLAEFSGATKDLDSLSLSNRLFALMEKHNHEPKFGGYIEGSGQDWGKLSDMRLSEKEPQCRKSMNTMLHVLEGYAGLLRIDRNRNLAGRVGELLEIFLTRIYDPQTGHFRLYFNDDWSWGEPEAFSYGHDIEGSWLLAEAAEILGDQKLIEQTRKMAIHMAETVYREALQPDGRMLNESPGSTRERELHWWVHAEAVVGFVHAFQLTGNREYLDGALRVWGYIDRKFIDHHQGDWYKSLDSHGNPSPLSPKIGPWECPYHHSRMCLELLNRLMD